MSGQTGGHGFGNVGLGISGPPSPWRPVPTQCAPNGHPGSTYNPWCDKTWCLCGEVVRDGSAVDWSHVGQGPLNEYLQPDGTYATRTTEPVQLDLFGEAA